MVGGNYIWCLVIVVISMEFAGSNKWGDALKSSFGAAMQVTRGDNFFKGKLVSIM